jgi:hypothetical protein
MRRCRLRGALALSLLGVSTVLFAAPSREPTSLTLTGPSVVVFRASSAEIAKREPSEAFVEFRKDFESSTQRLLTALKSRPQIKVVVSAPDVIRFSDASVLPVWRYSVEGGYGYLFYQPGKPLRVFAGVRNADGLICEAARMFALKPNPPHCEP